MIGLLLGLAATLGSSTCDVTDHGAVPGDERDDTLAVQAAIDSCAGRGGTVIVPAGVFDVAHLRLKSQMTLHLAPGARLSHTTDVGRYPLVGEDDRALIFGNSVKDVTITGLGVIDGNGGLVWPAVQKKIDDNHLDRSADTDRVRFGLLLRGCSNVRVKDITIRDTPMFLMALDDCDGAIVDGVRLEAPIDSPNTDGLQIIDSRDVRVSNCWVSVGDDGIVTKAREKPIERLLVTNCTIRSDDGAVKFGTRSASAVRDSLFSDLVITDSRYGIALFMIHGGDYSNNRFSNIRIASGGRHPRTYPIFVDIDDRAEGRVGKIEGLTFDGIDITTGGNILIGGHPRSPVRDLTLSDIRMRSTSADRIDATAQKPRGNRRYQPIAGSPDFSGVDAHLVIGSATGVRLSNVDVKGAGKRPVLALPQTRHVSIDGGSLSSLPKPNRRPPSAQLSRRR
jgi:hypothetical protein